VDDRAERFHAAFTPGDLFQGSQGAPDAEAEAEVGGAFDPHSDFP
jgi:hypothetical protein